jgi:hypothetical protein
LPFHPSFVRQAVERGPSRDHAHAVAVGELALAREVVAVEPEAVEIVPEIVMRLANPARTALTLAINDK